MVQKNASDISDNSIAVFAGGTNGHVAFVEHVDRDTNGNPTTVYYTECNWGPANKGGDNNQYDPGYDCVLKSCSYSDFVNRSGKGNMLGYISAAKK